MNRERTAYRTPIQKSIHIKLKEVSGVLHSGPWLNDYTRTTGITSLLQQLGWQTPEASQNVARLCLLYKIVNEIVSVPLPKYIQPTNRIYRYCHSMTFCQIYTCKDSNKYSFFPLAIVQWNALTENCCDLSKSQLDQGSNWWVAASQTLNIKCLFLSKFYLFLAPVPIFFIHFYAQSMIMFFSFCIISPRCVFCMALILFTQ